MPDKKSNSSKHFVALVIPQEGQSIPKEDWIIHVPNVLFVNFRKDKPAKIKIYIIILIYLKVFIISSYYSRLQFTVLGGDDACHGLVYIFFIVPLSKAFMTETVRLTIRIYI